jgi:dTDP-4-amino-4,6-dideoxygalactose transaminase
MPIHLQPHYRRQEKVTLPASESVWTKLLTLPLYPDLSEEDQAYIIESILGMPLPS